MDKLVKEKIINKNKLLQFLPKELEFLTKQKYIVYKNKHLKTTYLIDIINKFLVQNFLLKKKSARLYSIILRKVYGEYYNYYFDYLKENNIISVIKEYLITVKSREYTINKLYLKSDIIRYENSDSILLRKWKKRFLEYEINNFNDESLTYHPITNSFVMSRLCDSLFKVEIDFNSAKDEIQELYDNNIINYDSYIANNMNIDAIQNSNIYYSSDEYGRFHTNFTTLKKDIRSKYLTINKEKVAELDIKNSQPIFLMQLLKDYDFHLNYKDEYNKYYQNVKNGTIYEQIAKILKSDREEAKKLVYKVFFGKNNPHMEYNRIFCSLYPNIYQFIVDFKLNNKLSDDDNNYHKIMSAELQNRESKLIFENICFYIFKKIPNIDLFTVHDSIFYPEKYNKEVKEIFFDYVHALFA